MRARSGAVHRFQFRAEIAARCEFWSTNLSPTLVELARERGYEAMAVRDLGLLNAKDWTLLEKIQNEDCTLVTNNVDEFRKRYARKAVLHAGAIFLVDLDPGQDVQRLAFAAALDEIDADADLVNLELLVEPEGSGFRARRLRLRRNNK